MRKVTRQLINKSTESFLLALEIINKPTVGYRIESFSILFINAWELLMKAHLFENSHGKKLSIFRRKKPKKSRESISIDECLSKSFTNDNDPIKKNIEYISEIRNAASHLIILELDPLFTRSFQSGVFNYINYLFRWFGISLDNTLKPGLLSLVTDANIPKSSTLKKRYNKEDFETITHLIKNFQNLEKMGLEGALSVEYTVAIVKNPKKADFVISSAKTGKKSAIIIEKSRDIDLSHPYNMKKAVNEIQKRVSKKKKITSYVFQAYCFVKGVKKTDKNDYFWKSKYFGSGQYSQKFIDEFVDSILASSKNISRWKKQYRQYLQSRRSKKK